MGGRRLRALAVAAATAGVWEGSKALERGLLPYVIASQTVPILAIAPMIVTMRWRPSLRDTWPVLVEAGLYTFTEALAGYVLGCGLGLVAAMVVSRSPGVADALLPWAIASASVPIVALAPLAIVWFGIAQGSKIAIVTLMTFFPTFVSTTRGLTSVSASSLELMQSYAASEWQVFARLRLPASLPFVFTALRACTTIAMIGAVVSEFFGGPMKSLGVYIKSTASLFQTRQAWSAIVVTCALGLAFYFVVALVERLVMPWRSERAEGQTPSPRRAFPLDSPVECERPSVAGSEGMRPQQRVQARQGSPTGPDRKKQGARRNHRALALAGGSETGV